MGLDLRLLILIASPISNAAQRDDIRFSWGHFSRSSHIAVGFVLGMPESDMLKELAAEDAFYGDLIIGNFDDAYPIFKMASMFRWVYTYCTKAPRVLTTNDRIFINIISLMNLLEAPENLQANFTVWGDFVTSGFDIRSSEVYLFSKDTIIELLPIVEKVNSKNEVLVPANEARGTTRRNVPNFINLQPSCKVKLHIACRISFMYQHYELWHSALNSQNITDNVNFRKDVSIVLLPSKSTRPIKSVINAGVSIISLLFLSICIV